MSDDTRTSTQPHVVDRAERSRFEILLDERAVGFADYSVRDGVMTMPHTVVEPAYGGRGLGGTLVQAALDSAREQGLRVRPICSFVAAFIDDHPDYAELRV
jgi:uncharacterized protein